MLTQLATERLNKIKIICDQVDGEPEVIFIRGIIKDTKVLSMVCGGKLTKELLDEMQQVIAGYRKTL
jgi:hypothetical protein